MSGNEEGNTKYPLTLMSPSLPPGPCASSEVALANLVPGLCPHGVFLKPEDLTASVSLRAEPGFQAGRVSRQVRAESETDKREKRGTWKDNRGERQ